MKSRRRIFLLFSAALCLTACKSNRAKPCTVRHAAEGHFNPQAFAELQMPEPALRIPFILKEENLDILLDKMAEMPRKMLTNYEAAEKDAYSLMMGTYAMFRAGESFEIASIIRCMKTKSKRGWCRVELLEGEHRGKTGWAPCLHIVGRNAD